MHKGSNLKAEDLFATIKEILSLAQEVVTYAAKKL